MVSVSKRSVLEATLQLQLQAVVISSYGDEDSLQRLNGKYFQLECEM